MAEQKKIPELRFPNFQNEWESRKVKNILNRVANPVEVHKEEEYQEIGIRSHGKGIFHKEKTTGSQIGNKRVFWIVEDAFIVNIVFAWEHAVAKTTIDEIGMIASHRFPMYLPFENKASIDYLLHYFLTKKGKWLLELASPGGAGRNKTLGQQEFLKLEFPLPKIEEQQKIASFFTAIDKKISQLKQKKTLLEQYKKGVMQKIFSQEIRFRDENGQEFPKWEKKRLGALSERMTGKNSEGNENVLTISAQHGLVSQLDFFNKSVAAKDLSGYYLLRKDDFAYNKSYSAGYPMGAIKRLKYYDTGVVSTLYICFTFNTDVNLSFMEQYFESGKHNREIEKVAQEGARNHGLLNIGVNEFFSTEMFIPSLREQTKIANFLSAIDTKINYTQTQIENAERWKKGLLQKMFV